MKENKDSIKRGFLVAVTHPEKGGGFGLVWRIILLGKNRSTKQLYYVALIINCFKKRRVWEG